MFSIEKIYSYLNEDQKADLQMFIEEKIITEKQLIQILANSKVLPKD